MIKSTLSNPATRICYRKNIDANWHSGTTSTEKSSIFHIHSDLVTATYDFLLTGETANLLQALKAAKHSKHKCFNRPITADEFIKIEKYNLELKLSIKLFDNKEKVKFTLLTKNLYEKARSVTSASKLVKARTKSVVDELQKLESIYKTL